MHLMVVVLFGECSKGALYREGGRSEEQTYCDGVCECRDKECPKVFKGVQRCLWRFTKCSEVFEDVHEVFEDVREVFASVDRYL
jgi:hypothetical protein